VLRAEQLLGSVDRCLFHHIHMLTPPVPAAPGIALRILVGQAAALRLHHRRTGKVFRGDQLDVLRLTTVFLPHRLGHHWIGPRQIRPRRLAPTNPAQGSQPLHPSLKPPGRKRAGDPGLHTGPRVGSAEIVRPQTKDVGVVAFPRFPGRLRCVGGNRPHFGKAVRRHRQPDSRASHQHRPLNPALGNRLGRRLGDLRILGHIVGRKT